MKKLLIIYLLLLTGCSFHIYGRLGHQSAKKITVIIEDQVSDSNLPEIVVIPL